LAVLPWVVSVSPDFFATLGIALRSGRTLSAADRVGTQRVAVVNEEMARRYWPTGSAIGKCIMVGGDTAPCTTIVGVVQNVRQGAVDQPITREVLRKRYYLPLDQESNPARLMLFVRATGNAAAVVPSVRRLMEGMAPDLPFADVTAFSTALAPQLRPWRLGATVLGIFGGVALVLAVIGLYGVLAYRVSQRTHELGVRMALGGQQSDVLRLVVGQGLRVTALGVALGAGVALAGGRAIGALLYGVAPSDPLVYIASGVTLLGAAALASYIPARRAALVDPVEALREL
jgi:predicted permease